jgi:hypothetical protein
VLGKKVALEQAIGEQFGLPEPGATAGEVKIELQLPFRVAGELDAALAEIAAGRRMAEIAARRRPAFDADAQYVAIVGFNYGRHFEPGEQIVAGGELDVDAVRSLYERRKIAFAN